MSQEQAALLPQNPNLDVPAELADYFPIVATLTKNQLDVLKELATDLVSGNKRSSVEIAAECGISVRSVYNCRQNPAFGTALGVITREIVKGNTDVIIDNVIKASKTDWRAGKWLMEYTGQFIQRSQQLSIHASMEGQGQPGDFQSVIDDFLGIHVRISGYGPAYVDAGAGGGRHVKTGGISGRSSIIGNRVD